MTNEKLPMYKIIINELKDKIEGGEYKPGDKIPTELELTKEYGVSRVTVVSALNELVKQKLITRYPKKGSFVSGSAPSETSGKKPFTLGIKHVFGFILPSIEDIFALNLIKGITKRIHDEPNISVMIASSRNQEHEEQIITDMLKRNLDGIILFPVDQEIYNERILEMKLQMYPLVLIDRYLPGINTHYVISDNVLSGRLAAEHLYGLGHENICVCSSASAETFSVHERIQGVRQVTESKGIIFNEENIISDLHERILDADKKKKILRTLLAPGNTAFITTDSLVAMSLYRLLRENGQQIPKDKSILSFDEPISGAVPSPPFTHINQFEENMGYEAADIMVSLLNNQIPANNYVKKIIPPKIVTGGTTRAVNAYV